MTNLFPILYHIAQDSGVSLESDERLFLQSLYHSVQKHTTLKQQLSKDDVHVQEHHLPFIARIIKRTIGLIDDDDQVIYIPNQWFASKQTDDYVEVIRKSIGEDGTITYEQDFDEQYIAKYEEYIQKHQCDYFTDNIELRLDDESSSSSSSLHSLSHESIEHIVNEKMKSVRYDKEFENRFLDIWGAQYAFPDVSQNGFPSVHDEHFHASLYHQKRLYYSNILQKDIEQLSSVATFKDHQQLVRNYISPMTPYRSLLLIHATGTGKTLTTFSITEQFRDITYAQNKKIHITCPRREICNEFISYLKATEDERSQVKKYIQSSYTKRVQDSKHDFEHKSAEQYALEHYRIENYYAIFPKSFYEFMNHFKHLVHYWKVVLPNVYSIERKDYGLLIVADEILSNELPVLQSTLDDLAKTYVAHFKEKWKYTLEIKNGQLHIHVSETHALQRFEKQIVHDYANTLFVVDEAHRLVDTLSRTGVETSEEYENNNWRNMLLIVIAILRYHHYRMRLLLLTATPMINSDDDFFVLLNLLIYNDGLEHEKQFPIMKNMSIRVAKKRRQSAQFIKSIQARVSYFKNNADKPKQLFAEDVFYTVPNSENLSVLEGKCFPILLIDDFSSIQKGIKRNQTPYMVCDQRKATSSTHHIPLHQLTQSSSQQMHSTSQEIYVYVFVDTTLTDDQQHQWCSLLGSYIKLYHTIIFVGLHSETHHLKTLANHKGIQDALFANTSIKHPLWIPKTHIKRSIYQTSQQPMIYAHRLGNMKQLIQTYMTHTDDELKTLQYNPSVIATPMKNDAIITKEPDKTLKYNLANQLIHNWNVKDKTDLVYQPKIDTMLAIMDKLPGNILIYTNEVRLDTKNKTGAQILNFLKRRITQYYSQSKHSRLHNVKIEILHKETLHHTNEGNLSIELNERIQVINKTLLAKRDDVILIGSKEIMEGLTMDEIRQVHILDPAWNMAQMEQVMGRAIRIGNHKKHKEKRLHNVCCFLHISVPEQPFQTQQQSVILLNTLNAMERSFSDIHRYRLMQNKLKNIQETNLLLQCNAIDTVFLDEKMEKNKCILTDTESKIDHHPWKIIQYVQPSIVLYDRIASLRSLFLASHSTQTHVKPMKESMRNEIDWFKYAIPVIFPTRQTYFQTFDEICRCVQPYGYFEDSSLVSQSFALSLDIDYYNHHLQITHPHIQCVSYDDVLKHASLLPPLLHQQLLLSVLLCQYKWFTQSHSSKAKTSKTDTPLTRIHIDETSLFEHDTWKSFGQTQTSAPTMKQLLKTKSKSMTTYLKKIVQTLANEYTLIVHTNHTRKTDKNKMYPEPTSKTLKDKCIYGIQLQTIHYDAIEQALHELLMQSSPIVLHDKMYYLKYYNTFYTLVPFHIPRSNAYWNTSMIEETSVEHTNLTPYSVSLGEEKQYTLPIIQTILSEIISLSYAIQNELQSNIPTEQLLLYSCEYAFDTMSIHTQNECLQFIAIHGLDSIFTPENMHFLPTLRKALTERLIEKGHKKTDIFPNHAQQLLNELFPQHAGRVFFKFPQNPATEHCKVYAYEKTSKQKTQSRVSYTKLLLQKHSKVEQYAIHFFSPIPIRNTIDKQTFYSSPNVHNVSTQPLLPNTHIFGYNEVLNFKNKLASHFQMKICIGNTLRDVPIDTPDVDMHLETFQTQHKVFQESLQETIEKMGTLEDEKNIHVRPNASQCCKYILLRHHHVFLRFFYPGIVTKHPNKEYYASYKHILKKRLLG